MTVELAPATVAARLQGQFPEILLEIGANWLMLEPPMLLDVCRFLRDDPELDFTYLTCLTSVDRLDYFEVVYILQSLTRNQIATLKARVDHEEPVLPSVYQIWYGAHLQEAEVYDLMGIRFEGHPNLRRIFLWEGFAGWPLRKDFLQVERGAFHPGLPHFPKEAGQRGVLSGPNWSAPGGHAGAAEGS
jgi:NADH-quinone oxidoreductase subunit C